MIQEDYVSLEIARLLSEKKFNEECLMRYVDEKLMNVYDSDFPSAYELDNCGSEVIDAPTLQMAMEWLRLTHKIYIQAFAPVYDMDCAELGVTYNVIITNLANQCLAFDTPLDDIEYNSPKEAHEAALKYCLENLI
jgi:hypothetical protein